MTSTVLANNLMKTLSEIKIYKNVNLIKACCLILIDLKKFSILFCFFLKIDPK